MNRVTSHKKIQETLPHKHKEQQETCSLLVDWRKKRLCLYSSRMIGDDDDDDDDDDDGSDNDCDDIDEDGTGDSDDGDEYNNYLDINSTFQSK